MMICWQLILSSGGAKIGETGVSGVDNLKHCFDMDIVPRLSHRYQGALGNGDRQLFVKIIGFFVQRVGWKLSKGQSMRKCVAPFTNQVVSCVSL